MVAQRRRRPAAKPGFLDERTRVTFFLPVTSPEEHQAMHAIIRYLKNQHSRKVPIRGFTHTQGPDYVGSWWNEGAWFIPEEVVVFLIDFAERESNPNFDPAIARLKEAIERSYRSFGSVQKEVWITAERIRRFVGRRHKRKSRPGRSLGQA